MAQAQPCPLVAVVHFLSIVCFLGLFPGFCNQHLHTLSWFFHRRCCRYLAGRCGGSNLAISSGMKAGKYFIFVFLSEPPASQCVRTSKEGKRQQRGQTRLLHLVSQRFCLYIVRTSHGRSCAFVFIQQVTAVARRTRQSINQVKYAFICICLHLFCMYMIVSCCW